MDNWTLKIELDDLETQRERDPELSFPNDESSRIVKALSRIWGLLPDDLEDKELIEWDSTEVIIHAQVLDQLEELFTETILMRTRPKRITLTRND